MSAPQQFSDHLQSLWQASDLTTPAFVYDEFAIIEKLGFLAKFREASDCNILYSVKALSFTGVLNTIAAYVDGFSTSSSFECQLAKEILGNRGSIHITSPGIRQTDMDIVSEFCDYINFNSISQWQQCRTAAEGLNCGLRVNPELSFVKDERYNPSRNFSKLGVPLSQLASMGHKEEISAIKGILIHNNCESEDFQQLAKTVEQVCDSLNNLISGLEWINLGGGYLFNSASQLDILCEIVTGLKEQYGLDVFFEPGKAIVGRAGYLVASIIDLLDSGGKVVAILDTTVNHLPEVFEYQYKPNVLQENPDGIHEYRLAGASCLSGDIFGDYHFDEELQVGSRIIFANVGAYMFVKANMFNGINLPAVYSLSIESNLQLQKEFSYTHFRSRL